MAVVSRIVPNLRAKAAETGISKKNHTCPPLPERDRSTATGIASSMQTSLKKSRTNCYPMVFDSHRYGFLIYLE
jgi:spore coat protein CotF